MQINMASKRTFDALNSDEPPGAKRQDRRVSFGAPGERIPGADCYRPAINRSHTDSATTTARSSPTVTSLQPEAKADSAFAILLHRYRRAIRDYALATRDLEDAEREGKECQDELQKLSHPDFKVMKDAKAKRLDKVKSNIKTLDGRLEESRDSSEKAEAELAASLNNIHSKTSAIAADVSAIQNSRISSKDIDGLKATLEKHDKENQTVREDTNTIGVDVATLKADLKKLSDNYSSIDEGNKEMSNKLDSKISQASLDDFKREITESSNAIQKYFEAQLIFIALIKDTKDENEVGDLSDGFGALKRHLDLVGSQTEKAQNDLQAIRDELVEYSSMIRDAPTKEMMEKLEAKINTAPKELPASNPPADPAMSKKIEETAADLLSLETKIHEDLAAREELLESYEHRIFSLESKQTQAPQPIEPSAELTHMKESLSRHESATNQINQIRLDVSALQEVHRILDDRFNNLTTEELVRQMCAEFNRNFGFDKYERQLTDLSIRVNGLQRITASGKSGAPSEVTAEVTGRVSRLENLNLETKLATLEQEAGKISQIQGLVEQFSYSVGQLENRVAQAENNISEVKGEVSSARESIHEYLDKTVEKLQEYTIKELAKAEDNRNREIENLKQEWKKKEDELRVEMKLEWKKEVDELRAEMRNLVAMKSGLRSIGSQDTSSSRAESLQSTPSADPRSATEPPPRNDDEDHTRSLKKQKRKEKKKQRRDAAVWPPVESNGDGASVKRENSAPQKFYIDLADED